jgi:hypothetical protein
VKCSRGGVFASPGQISVGRIHPGQEVTKTVHIVDFAAPTKAQVTATENRSGRIRVSQSHERIQPPESLAAFGFVSSVIVDLRAPDTVGSFADQVTILLSGSDQMKTVVPVIGTVVPAVEISPSPLVIVDKPGKVVTRTILCTCDTGAITDLKLNERSSAAVSIHRSSKSELGPGAFDVTFVLPPDSHQQVLELTAQCGQGGRALPATVKIVSYGGVSDQPKSMAQTTLAAVSDAARRPLGSQKDSAHGRCSSERLTSIDAYRGFAIIYSIAAVPLVPRRL